MKKLFLFILIISISLTFGQSEIPTSHEDLHKTISYEQMENFISRISNNDLLTVSVEGKTQENRKLYLLHFSHKKNTAWKVFFFAQQHGNEPAGKDALIYLSKRIIENPDYLPEDVELWIMPMVNPDGAVLNKRRNAIDADLNRDHLLLAQVETRVLHNVFRKIMPHISVDCHEFGRDSRDYADMGWSEWPLIMMDCGNHPLMGNELYYAGVDWVNRLIDPMNEKGFNYCRYYLGGIPPKDELRHSTLEADDARNSLALYGGLSFIIESGIYKNADNPDENLHERVGAYLKIFDAFIHDASSREKDLENIHKWRAGNIPDFIPVNYFWGSTDVKTRNVKIIEKASGKIRKIPTPNFMGERIVKNSVGSPAGYVIPAEKAKLFKELLEKHHVGYQMLTQKTDITVEGGKLIRMEDFRDPLYNRYAGRQIVKLERLGERSFSIGSIVVELDQQFPERIINLLEPSLLYGLYQHDSYHKLINEDQMLPVFRILKKE